MGATEGESEMRRIFKQARAARGEARHWSEVRRIFEEARALAAEERPAFTRDACGDDAQVLADVQELLDAWTQSVGFLEAPGSRPFLEQLHDRLVESRVGSQVGPYLIERALVKGERRELFEAVEGSTRRLIALSVVEQGAIDADAERRIREAAQPLLQLRHPGIATCQQVGVHREEGEGGPRALLFLSAELVQDAVPIDAYAAEVDLPVQASLRLFRAVCEAVQYAHGHGLVHGDLEAGSVLVSSTDEPPAPVLFDLGLAQLAGEDRAPTVADDVHGLGALLYVLLCRRPPPGLDGLPVRDWGRALAGDDPPRPGAVVPGLPAGLDRVVQRALCADPGERHGSAADLWADVDGCG